MIHSPPPPSHCLYFCLSVHVLSSQTNKILTHQDRPGHYSPGTPQVSHDTRLGHFSLLVQHRTAGGCGSLWRSSASSSTRTPRMTSRHLLLSPLGSSGAPRRGLERRERIKRKTKGSRLDHRKICSACRVSAPNPRAGTKHNASVFVSQKQQSAFKLEINNNDFYDNHWYENVYIAVIWAILPSHSFTIRTISSFPFENPHLRCQSEKVQAQLAYKGNGRLQSEWFSACYPQTQPRFIQSWTMCMSRWPFPSNVKPPKADFMIKAQRVQRF